MEFSVKAVAGETAECLHRRGRLRTTSPFSDAEQLDKISDGYISALLRRGELEGKPGEHCCCTMFRMYFPSEFSLLVAAKNVSWMSVRYKQVIQKTINTLNDTGSMEAVCFLTELHVKGRNNYWKVRQAVETAKRRSTVSIS